MTEDLDLEEGIGALVRLPAALLALGAVSGLVMAYNGAWRLALGARMRAIDFERITALGLLFALGFAALIAAGLYVAFGVFKWW